MTTPSKPTVLSPRFDDVPLELQAIPHWVIWKLEYVVQDERWTKPPYDRKGVKTNPTNPASWSTFDDVVAAYDGDKRFDGVGFALDGTDDIVGIDLDDLKDHLYQSEVHAVYEALLHSGTYIEQSPSGTGLRAFLHGRLPFRGKRNATLGIEVYGTKRYLTVTGHRIQTAGQEIVDDQRCIDAIVAVAFPAKKPVNVDLTGAATDPVPTFLRDDEVQRRARNARNGEHFFLLWDGRWQEYYELRGKQVASQSEADLALCSMLAFWTAKNAAQIDRLFRQSRLMREVG